MKALINEIKERATSDVNPFWRKVQIFGGCVLAVGTIIVAAPIALPAGLVAAGTYMVTIGTTVAGLSQLTKK